MTSPATSRGSARAAWRGPGAVRLGVGAIGRPDDGIDACLTGDCRERRRQAIGQQCEEVGHGATIVACVGADRRRRSGNRPRQGGTVRSVVPCPAIGRSSPSPLLPTSLVGSYAQPDWLIDRAKLADRFPPRVAPPSCGESRRSGWRRRRTTPLSSPSSTRSGRDSTSSPTGRCAGRATPTASPRPSTASTSTTREQPSIAAATPTRCPASSARSVASTRFRSATFVSCGRTRIAPSRSPCPVRSRCRSRPRTTSTTAKPSSPSATPPR